MNGSSYITCLSNGSWSIVSPCEKIDCGPVNIPHGSIVNFTDARYQSTFSVTCDEDYSLTGSDIVQCGIDGKWVNVPSCKLIPCGLPNIPENGAIDKINGTVGKKTATMVCQPGFIMNGTSIVNCVSHGKWSTIPSCFPVSDCFDVYQDSNSSLSGIYNVTLWKSKEKIQVLCDMDTDGGKWTVFQYRFNGSVDFYKTFSDYENGFGNLNGEFWLGLKFIQEMVSQSRTELRIDMSAADDTKAFANFQDFHLGIRYTLYTGGRTGTAGDIGRDLRYNIRRNFYTQDRDNTYNCARASHGAWWYYHCSYVNLNGRYLIPGTHISKDRKTDAMVYLSFRMESLKTSRMMFRRVPLCKTHNPCDNNYVPPSG